MKSSRALVDEALALVRTLSVEQACERLGREGVLFIDIRESAELRSEGRLPGAFHAPRGLLEFWIDPTSPWHQPALAPHKELVLFCAAGWRSALAARTLLEMGVPADRVSHLGGGFNEWKAAGAPVESPAAKG